MRGYHSAPVRTAGRFVVTPYHLGDGQMRPVLPERCLHALATDLKACRVRISHYRARKTGPGYSVAVLRCATHGRASTLYPPGHVPYGRVLVAPVDAQGELVRSGEVFGAAGPAWEVTLFAGAVSAAAGKLWFKETSSARMTDARPTIVGPSRRTQGRHLHQAARLLGIAPGVSLAALESMARTLAVPCLELRAAARDLTGDGGYCDDARVIMRVLRQLRPARGVVDQLLAAGELAGLWGAPSRWDPGGSAVRGSGGHP